MKNGWEEVDPRDREIGRSARGPYVVLRPKEGKIYFSFGLRRDYLQGCKRIIIRYNRVLNMLSFVRSENGSRAGYKLSSKGAVGARNLFNMMEIEMTKRSAFFVRYNEDAKWLEVRLNENREGEMKWLKV